MLEATVTKTIVEPHNGDLYLLGVCEYYGEKVNFRVKFSGEDVRHSEAFFEDLKDALAEELGLPTYRVSLNTTEILNKMIYWAYKFESLGIH